jgi:hypothetical protein
MRSCVAVVGLLLLGLVVGCGDSDSKRLRLSGSAKFDGQPIVYGDVVLTPDGAKKNSGPQGFAVIRDGRYDTSDGHGKGFAGGPTVIHVTGFSAEGGKLLCEYEYTANLPTTDGTFDIEVPKAGAPGAKKTVPEI